ncbi:MAG: hypothetical protein LBN18_00655 [Dysgonamonadaceae bacterium]|nr:hypothetical protein [Dysgonamonadaceae bacterium]
MRVQETLFFIAAVILMLLFLSLSFPEEGVVIAGKRLYFPSVEEALMQEPDTSANVLAAMDAMEESLTMDQLVDSAAITHEQAYQDSLLFYTNFFETHPSRIYLPDNDLKFFDTVFDQMENCRKDNQVVHILHYGDSQIEGDRITGFIREQLQEKFGGNGPGLLPAVQPIPSAAVGQTASGNLKRYIISGTMMDRVSHRRYGALGQVAQVMNGNSISVATRNWKGTFEQVKTFSKVRLYVGYNNGLLRATLKTSDQPAEIQTIGQAHSEFEVLTWNLAEPVKKITLNLSGSAEIYGLSLDGNYGVAVDNIPLRGSAGTFFTDINPTVMRSMLQDLNVSLIIMEFGGNKMPAIRGNKNISDYKKQVSEQINYFRQINPTMKILLIGPADMSTKVNGKLQTYPFLEQTIDSMRTAALENGAAFWDMYQVMGGRNSMIKWVQNKPALAAPDYIHFTPKGADRIAKTFYESLMIYYDYAHFQKQHKQQMEMWARQTRQRSK